MAETVYVLGAGFNQSVESWGGLRPPLATNFFQMALGKGKFSDDHYTNLIEPVYEYIARYYKKTKDDLRAEPFDVEDIFTMLQQQQGAAQQVGDRAELIQLARTDFLLKSFLAEFLSEFEHSAVKSEVMRGLGRTMWDEQPTIITFNYDCILEGIIESGSGVTPPAPESRLAAQRTDVRDEELPFRHHNWNRPLGYAFKFSEVELQRPGVATYVRGERFYGHPENQLYSWPVLKLHGSLNWFRYLPVRKHPSSSGNFLWERGTQAIGGEG